MKSTNPQSIYRSFRSIFRIQCCVTMLIGFLSAISPALSTGTPVASFSTHQTPPDESLWCEFSPPADTTDLLGAGKRIVLIAGDDEYRSEESLPMLGKILAKHHGFAVTVLFPINPETKLIQPSFQTNIPGLHRLEGADLVVMGLRFRQLPDDQMEHIDRYVRSGKPLIGFRTSTHAFNFPANSPSRFRHYSYNSKEGWIEGFGKEFFGETWVNHHGEHNVESTRGLIESGASAHPILRGVKDVWGDTDVYGIRSLPEDASILLRGQILTGMQPTDPAVDDARNQPMMPLAWTRLYPRPTGGATRIFCTTMGSATDFENESLRRVLVNACYWCLEMEDQIPARSQVDYVAPFHPTKFGFGTERNDLKPADFSQKD